MYGRSPGRYPSVAVPTLKWNLTLVTRTLDDGDVRVGGPLRFAEVSCCDAKRPRLRRLVRRLARELLAGSTADALHRRALPGDATVERVEVTLPPPPKRRADWAEPVTLAFHLVRWRHDERTHVAAVPALGIEVIARAEAELPRLVGEHVLAAVRRTKAAESLFALALTQRTTALSLRPMAIRVAHRTAKQVARADEDGPDGAKGKPLIRQVGTVLGDDAPLPPAYEVDRVVAQVADALTGRVPRSVLLVGPSGAGKTTVVYGLARDRAAVGMADAPLWSTSGSRLIAGAGGYGAWQERCQRLVVEAKRDGAVLHLGNLVELMQVGRANGSQGIAGFMKVPLGRGTVLAIAECTPEQLGVIERQDPQLLERFAVVRVDEPDAATARRILRRVADETTAGAGDDVLDRLDQLHRRYATYSAAPGRPVRFLRDLLRDRPAEAALTPADVTAAFARETGLPLALLDPDVPLDLVAARATFAQQLVGQDGAVDLVTDLLATVKAGLARPRRPIASLLFVGPTGVGKTEMAKALAGYFFGDRGRLSRFDMSEYATPAAVERLVGGGYGAAEGLLTAKVREQPFAVVLLDEFEKAHPALFDLLLQVLGDGRLTDAAGRVADFTNAVVILTSNLGAESFGRGSFGLNAAGGTNADAAGHFTDAVRSFVRPELFNRIDRVVPFLPLGRVEIAAIADRELAAVERRDGFRLRGLTLTVAADARQSLADGGYDVRYGARPLKRAIERQLLGPLADAVNGYPAGVRLDADAAAAAGGAVSVAVRARVDDAGRVASAVASGSAAAAAAEACSDVRRDVQRLVACPPVLTATNLLFQLERAQKRDEAKARTKRKPVYDVERAEQIRELQDLLGRVASLAEDADAAEDVALSAVYGDGATEVTLNVPALQRRLRDLLLRLLARQVSRPDRVVLGLLGDPAAVVPLAGAYASVARVAGFAVVLCWYEVRDRSAFARHAVDDADKLLASPPASLAGVAMAIAGRYARLYFAAERGVHVMARDGKAKGCLVDAGDKPLRDYAPPGINSWPTANPTGVNARRSYDLSTKWATDATLGKELPWSGRSIEPVVAMAIEQQLDRAARGVLGP